MQPWQEARGPDNRYELRSLGHSYDTDVILTHRHSLKGVHCTLGRLGLSPQIGSGTRSLQRLWGLPSITRFVFGWARSAPIRRRDQTFSLRAAMLFLFRTPGFVSFLIFVRVIVLERPRPTGSFLEQMAAQLFLFLMNLSLPFYFYIKKKPFFRAFLWGYSQAGVANKNAMMVSMRVTYIS